jgi:multisubunit Na+/H+ antiporter MnhE subunit
MAKAKTKKKPFHRQYRERLVEADGVYFLKLIIVVLLSTFWIKLASPLEWNSLHFGGFPFGALFSLVGVRLYERNQLDRKIWFAVIVIVMILSYFAPAGIVV